MKRLLTTLLLLLSLSLFAQAKETPTQKDHITITDITDKNYSITGTNHGLDIKGLEGKIVFLEFFGHRCPPCLRSIPHLIRLQEKYKEKLAVIAVEVQGLGNERLKEFAQRKGINYTVVADEKASIFVEYISQRAEWRGGIPFMVALDTKGDVQFVQAGMVPEASLERLIEELTPKKAVKAVSKEHNISSESNSTTK